MVVVGEQRGHYAPPAGASASALVNEKKGMVATRHIGNVVNRTLARLINGTLRLFVRPVTLPVGDSHYTRVMATRRAYREMLSRHFAARYTLVTSHGA